MGFKPLALLAFARQVDAISLSSLCLLLGAHLVGTLTARELFAHQASVTDRASWTFLGTEGTHSLLRMAVPSRLPQTSQRRIGRALSVPQPLQTLRGRITRPPRTTNPEGGLWQGRAPDRSSFMIYSPLEIWLLVPHREPWIKIASLFMAPRTPVVEALLHYGAKQKASRLGGLLNSLPGLFWFLNYNRKPPDGVGNNTNYNKAN